MEHKTKDLVYAVFLDSDNNLMDLKRERITFSEEDADKVSVCFPTEDINEEGKLVVENKAYSGTAVFSGGKCYYLCYFFLK